jgi:hypothetical protein
MLNHKSIGRDTKPKRAPSIMMLSQAFAAAEKNEAGAYVYVPKDVLRSPALSEALAAVRWPDAAAPSAAITEFLKACAMARLPIFLAGHDGGSIGRVGRVVATDPGLSLDICGSAILDPDPEKAAAALKRRLTATDARVCVLVMPDATGAIMAAALQRTGLPVVIFSFGDALLNYGIPRRARSLARLFRRH